MSKETDNEKLDRLRRLEVVAGESGDEIKKLIVVAMETAVERIIQYHEQTTMGHLGKREDDPNQIKGVTVGSVWRAIEDVKR